VVDGVPRSDKRPTWRAEIYVPRDNGVAGGGVCIRGPNRFNEDEAESDLVEFQKVAEQFKGGGVAKEVRSVSSRLKTKFERQKHIESGHAEKAG